LGIASIFWGVGGGVGVGGSDTKPPFHFNQQKSVLHYK
jgi:hypothetical protein